MKSFKGHIVSLPDKRIFDGLISIRNGIIVSIQECNNLDETYPYIIPGFIDSHVHIESSMLTPCEFARMAIRHGTTGIITDPHEIANVLGMKGIQFMLDNAAKVPAFNFCFGAPSCVPSCSPEIETNGASITSKEVDDLLNMPQIGYLSEMMNTPGVLQGDPEVMAKIESARRHGEPIDGHAPGLSETERARYAANGISTDHECHTLEEAVCCIRNGMKVLIREGSSAKDFNALSPLIDKYPDDVMFCTDDMHPGDLKNGHINSLVKKSFALGYDLWNVLKVACLNPQLHYGLNWGLIREGDPATFNVVDSLSPSMNILETLFNGENSIPKVSQEYKEFPNKFEAEEIGINDIKDNIPNLNPIIIARDGDLITSGEYIEKNDPSYPWKEVQKIVVINRYVKGATPSIGFVKGFNIKNGAMAASIAHDCHNIVAIGSSNSQLVRVINEVIKMKGGIAALSHDSEITSIPLPIAGLMSPLSGDELAEENAKILKTIASTGCKMISPLITMAFMCLAVIPRLKITDKGLFDMFSKENSR